MKIILKNELIREGKAKMLEMSKSKLKGKMVEVLLSAGMAFFMAIGCVALILVFSGLNIDMVGTVSFFRMCAIGTGIFFIFFYANTSGK